MSKLNKSDVLITTQTGWNEAYLIGTEKELLNFAQSIIETVQSAKSDIFFGEKVKTSKHIYGKVSFASEVQFDEVVVTESVEQTDEIQL
ncbi:hypothetical protein CS022_24545 [Veronia nyctiphanis]|uniref:Uncharacterized protein n=1 Tax=Veronia nyctiphanis TaxID=1278244 RepID=A0A4Q0Y953_9GAMM|nr:hypothetical protein [Veronia nyctiphanis]RXJ66513.1 hypothetical protein CS022_24545 [Veronia nyctiphanis]